MKVAEMQVPKDGLIKLSEMARGKTYFISFEKPVVISIRGVKILDVGKIRLINSGNFIDLTLFLKGVAFCTTTFEFGHNLRLKRDDYYEHVDVFVLEEIEKVKIQSKTVGSLKNLNQGLENFTNKCKDLSCCTLEQLLTLYANIAILIDKSMDDYSKEIAYPAQDLQSFIHAELENRINS
ncbi:hypothetical protein ACJDU8_15570 [Clostridium sp. WILCCON 0269]|uniref:DUF2357 domain-containing protein n=1 Tax=Candidatus Clostridium eludens TaxID=3381663 RepID=A0ABW8SNN9_9CLOT